ncbi:MAG: tandem-95 repeat protein [Anaerolineales bacterium]|nr:tandem-95 repeat protein [Anaerolineales bacterium]
MSLVLLGWRGSLQADVLANCPDISTLNCTEVKLQPDQTFAFDGADGGLIDTNGVGIGFTMVDPPSKVATDAPGTPVVPFPETPGYYPSLLEIANGNLTFTTTNGINYQAINRQTNAVGIGLEMGSPVTLKTTLVDLPPAAGGQIQAGLWFGQSSIGPSGLGGTGTAEDNYLKIVVISGSAGQWEVEAMQEVNKVEVTKSRDPIDVSGNQPVTLWLELNPSLRTVVSRYCVGVDCTIDDSIVLLTFTGIPGEWFSTDQAGIDFSVGTRSMAGLMTSHRNLTEVTGAPLNFSFSEFAYYTGVSVLPIASEDGVDFDTWSIILDGEFEKPTAMDMGPDGRLYMVDVTGVIHAFEIDYENRQVLQKDMYTAVANRLTLGLAVDPDSTPDNVILWVGHSDISQEDGEANSGTITRLSGPDFSVREDVVTGLPRAIANHATNNIEFGPDGRLYIAQGGNTGAGASNNGGSEFGSRPEQPLAAAILAIDVKNPDLDKTCAPAQDPDEMDATGIASTEIPCDVEVYASGARNVYDLVFHSNGELYAPDNGLGVVGTIPNLQPDDLTWQPGDGCEGMIMGPSEIAAHYPDVRPDLLYRVEQGAYYGHPNPSRDECVFYGGNPTAGDDFPIPASSDAPEPFYYMDTFVYDVGVQPEANFEPAIFSFGPNHSVDGVVEYQTYGQNFCGQLDGELLLTYFSQADQVRRVALEPGGLAVASDQTLIRSSAGAGGAGLSNPLPIALDESGRVYVGEFGTNKITIFQPVNVGLWTTSGFADVPTAVLDAGSTAVGGKLYAVGGKLNTGPVRTLYAYDPQADSWTQLADMPNDYPAVENPVAVNYDGKIYAFGGSTEPFSGAVSKAAVYDPQTNNWTMLTDMPTPRAGAGAQAIGNLIYVAGGLGADGASTDVLEIYDPLSNTWSSGANLLEPRDNPGFTMLNDRLYLFGGRTRDTLGQGNGTLNSVEYYDPLTDTWTNAAPMPTGRRTMNVAVLNGQAIVIGGEATDDSQAFRAVEGYDPVTDSWRLLTNMPAARQGAIGGAIDGVIYIAAGGTTAGSSFTAAVNAFDFDCAFVEFNPIIAVNDQAETPVNTPVLIDVLANDTDPTSTTLTVTQVTDPANGTAVISGTQVLYTPDLDFTGTDNFNYTVTNGTQFASANVSVDVLDGNTPRPPLAQNDVATTTLGIPVQIPVLANDTDPLNGTLTLVSVSTPAQGTAVIEGSTIVYTPTNNAPYVAQFSYTVANADGTATAQVTVNVVEDAPVGPIARDDTATTTLGTNATIDVLANDTDPLNGTLSIVRVGTPTTGVAFAQGGKVVYMPSGDVPYQDSVTYTISNGQGQSTAVVTVNVVESITREIYLPLISK